MRSAISALALTLAQRQALGECDVVELVPSVDGCGAMRCVVFTPDWLSGNQSWEVSATPTLLWLAFFAQVFPGKL